jgi:hypothetical protein
MPKESQKRFPEKAQPVYHKGKLGVKKSGQWPLPGDTSYLSFKAEGCCEFFWQIILVE